jgi:hypothetical protein
MLLVCLTIHLYWKYDIILSSTLTCLKNVAYAGKDKIYAIIKSLILLAILMKKN